MDNSSEKVRYPNVLSDILQRHVGRHGQVSVEALAAEAKTAPRTLYEIRRGKFTPSFDLAMRIVRALPEEAAAEFLASVGFMNPRRADGKVGCFRRLHSSVTGLAHTLARMFEDGRVDHMEAAELRKVHLPALQVEASRCTEQRP